MNLIEKWLFIWVRIFLVTFMATNKSSRECLVSSLRGMVKWLEWRRSLICRLTRMMVDLRSRGLRCIPTTLCMWSSLVDTLKWCPTSPWYRMTMMILWTCWMTWRMIFRSKSRVRYRKGSHSRSSTNFSPRIPRRYLEIHHYTTTWGRWWCCVMFWLSMILVWSWNPESTTSCFIDCSWIPHHSNLYANLNLLIPTRRSLIWCCYPSEQL